MRELHSICCQLEIIAVSSSTYVVWRFGIVVTLWPQSMKLLYVGLG